MGCKHFLGTILDAAADLEARSIDLEAHLRSCRSCWAKFHELQRTMDVLDEWRCPEPSSRFDSQLRGRLLEASISSKTL